MSAPITFFICGRPRVECYSQHCNRAAIRTCCFPIKREGQQVQCEKPVCDKCQIVVDGKEYCQAHGRVMQGKVRKP